MSNKCPYCGWECVEIVGSPYRGIGRGRCPNCQSNGPEVSPPSFVIDAFCHPAHLMTTMPTYDPVNEMIITKDEAELFLFACEQFGRVWVYARTNRGTLTSKAADRLRAALEVGK
jgi:hypothetical protein